MEKIIKGTSSEILEVHLKKFENIDLLLFQASEIVMRYFLKQNIINNIDEFNNILKLRLLKYKSFIISVMNSEGEYDEKQSVNEKNILDIISSFSELIFFGEANPYFEAKLELVRARVYGCVDNVGEGREPN